MDRLLLGSWPGNGVVGNEEVRGSLGCVAVAETSRAPTMIRPPSEFLVFGASLEQVKDGSELVSATGATT